MLPENFKEISKFFVENFDNSANAIFTVLDMLKLNDKSLCFSTNYNAKYSQTVKFILILLMPAEVAAPKISPESTIQAPAPTKYYEYDVETQEGQEIRLSAM